MIYRTVLTLHFQHPFKLISAFAQYVRHARTALGYIEVKPVKRFRKQLVRIQELRAGTGTGCDVSAVVSGIMPASGDIDSPFPIIYLRLCGMADIMHILTGILFVERASPRRYGSCRFF